MSSEVMVSRTKPFCGELAGNYHEVKSSHLYHRHKLMKIGESERDAKNINLYTMQNRNKR